jgi:hypothetical protein
MCGGSEFLFQPSVFRRGGVLPAEIMTIANNERLSMPDRRCIQLLGVIVPQHLAFCEPHPS